MALNKAKVLKTAEKYVIQGKISHAISEYQKLIKEDPTDLPLVNTLGDLYVRIGNISEAVRCFGRLAESYDNGGFVVRAIAMYKKVSKIDPGQIQALTRLADLYLRQGLNSDARTHYLQVADSLIKKGDMENAVTIYLRILEVDPENPAIDGRIAEVYNRVGKRENAISSFLSAALKSRRKGSLEEAVGYLKKALELDETDVQVLLTYSGILSDLGRSAEALSNLGRIPLHDFKPEVLETSFGIQLKSGNLSEAEKIAHQLLDLDSQYFKLFVALANVNLTKGDWDTAAAQAGKASELAHKHAESKQVETQLKNILQKAPEHIPSILELIRLYTLSKQPQNIPTLLETAGDIFTRRGQFAEAASIYTQLVQLEPNDPVHRDRLGQVQEKLGVSGSEVELPKLVPDMGALAERFLSEPTLKTLSPDAAIAEPSEQEQSSHEAVKGYIIEGDLFAGYGLFQKAIDQYQQATAVIPHHIEAHEKIRDMCAKSGDLARAAQECLVLANIYTARGDSGNANRNFTLAYQYDPNLHQEPIISEAPPPAPRDAEAGPAAEASTKREDVSPGRAAELLQEADFYLDLGFLAEAKFSMDQYLRVAEPNAEFQRRQERYDGLLKSGKPAPQAEPPQPAEVAEEIGITEFESTTVVSTEEEKPEADVTRAIGFETTSYEEEVPKHVGQTPQLPSESTPGETFDEMMIDLDQELGESALEKTAAPLISPTAVPAARSLESAGTAGLEDVFEEFKEGMEDDHDSGDYETHYNLGIAFREMGLLEESISEFQKAMKGVGYDAATEEFVRCCNMLGLCFVEKGLPQVAVKWFTKGLSSPGRNEETYQAMRYDLGCAHEMAGNEKAALETFLDVYGININYRDVSEKIENLKIRLNGK